ncbi:DNA polymerase I [Sulfuriroseicoccus oceanibius]|uniref:DNA polymerase I n=1 Tax=Sulfuriroseicoccus oceanibius TaxID=2707525 RepID=A0A6B3LCM3_9BACT|nr:DNA polymerase I [Sulfuriroseicoccus oceanibius]QQL45139.1 DNA polymerase I [Sulfuriroseicoccus oceanibius]
MADDYDHRLFLLDGMALIYRAHFAMMRSPIRTTSGVNVSALFGFANTLLDLIQKQRPTHLALVLDTSAPTFRHDKFPEYKAQREAMPEELSAAIPHVKKWAKAMGLPVITLDGYEADDIIGTLARVTEAHDAKCEVFMVTPDKDFAQLVTEHVKIYKPGRQGSDPEVIGVEEVREKWGVEDPMQVVDILGLWGDASDNIPGVPGIGEKTAKKLVAQFGGVEGLIENVGSLKGKQKENVSNFREQAVLSKWLAKIVTDAPVEQRFEDLVIGERDDETLRAMCVEFEFNALGRKLFGGEFKAGRGFAPKASDASDDLFGASAAAPSGELDLGDAGLQQFDPAKVNYRYVDTAAGVEEMLAALKDAKAVCFDTETTSLNPRVAELLAIAFSAAEGDAWMVDVRKVRTEAAVLPQALIDWFANPAVGKVGQNLKYDLQVLAAHQIPVAGPFFDTMLVHGMLEPSQRHSMDFMAESLLGYSPLKITELIGAKGKDQKSMAEAMDEKLEDVVNYACEDADITWRLAEKLRPQLASSGQQAVYDAIEAPLLPVLVRMESEGIAIDTAALDEISGSLGERAAELRAAVMEAAGSEFNLNSPRQLGDVLFNQMKLVEKPKKTKTGQFVTNEQVLQSLAPDHKIVRDVLDYREVTKLKNTYVDTLPGFIDPTTQRVHTSFHQVVAATGRLASSDPNLQNIPIRTELGRGVRRAFVPRSPERLLMASDYSQIELRIMAAISDDEVMRQAFVEGADIHTATAAKVFGVERDEVTREQRSGAKMVNFGIIYGISAFGLSQRLGIPRKQAGELIESYLATYTGVKSFMETVVEKAAKDGYVETLGGRRRYLPDLNSRNHTIRSAAERMAINTPIQGTAADMIKLAMIRADKAFREAGFESKLILQVHDELLVDLVPDEEADVRRVLEEAMVNALPLNGVPIVVESGVGANWLAAH